MSVSYEKLWKLMKANRMNKKELAEASKISLYMIKKLSKNDYVSLEIIARFCKVFHCDVGDVVEMIEEE